MKYWIDNDPTHPQANYRLAILGVEVGRYRSYIEADEARALIVGELETMDLAPAAGSADWTAPSDAAAQQACALAIAVGHEPHIAHHYAILAALSHGAENTQAATSAADEAMFVWQRHAPAAQLQAA